MVFVYHLSRNLVEYVRSYDNLEQAVRSAHNDQEQGYAYPIKISDGRGETILDHDQLLEKFLETE